MTVSFRKEEAHDGEGQPAEEVHGLPERSHEFHESPGGMVCHHGDDSQDL